MTDMTPTDPVSRHWHQRADEHEAVLYEVKLACEVAALASKSARAARTFERLAELIGDHLDGLEVLGSPPPAEEPAP